MGEIANERILQAYARLTGFLYLFILVVSTVGARLSGGMHVRGDFARSAENIQEAELLYRTGLALGLTSAAMVILLGGTTYVLLRAIDRNLALIALLWRTGEAALGAFYMIFSFVALSIYSGGAEAFGPAQQEALAGLFRSGAHNGFIVATLYFSLGSIIFFLLLLRSHFVPRLLAAFGMLASAAVTVFGFSHLLFPQQAASLGWAGWAPILAAELVTGLWLLIRGVDLTWWRGRAGVVSIMHHKQHPKQQGPE